MAFFGLSQSVLHETFVRFAVLDLKSAPAGRIFSLPLESAGSEPVPDCTLTVSDEDMAQMVRVCCVLCSFKFLSSSIIFLFIQIRGSLQPQSAFMKGRLKVKGNIMLTQKLQGILGQAKNKL